jgi:hypothetical protein
MHVVAALALLAPAYLLKTGFWNLVKYHKNLLMLISGCLGSGGGDDAGPTDGGGAPA